MPAGDGHLTFQIRYTGEIGDGGRVTYYDRDYRGRALSIWEGYDYETVTGFRVTERMYDNFDRVTYVSCFRRFCRFLGVRIRK
ncbi:MAG: hypothetical protein JXP34_23990 [Planctomycetes bacterium]|nr:hypothetical protein [Planctomycetota bacterium]